MGYAFYTMTVNGEEKPCGYGVQATCESAGCIARIDRGLAYACGAEPGEMDDHCGGYFCGDHRYLTKNARGEWKEYCSQCRKALLASVSQGERT